MIEDGKVPFNFLYRTYRNVNCMFLPEGGWYGGNIFDMGRDPTCQLILPTDHIVIEGCGNVEINGTYSRNFRNNYEREYKRRGQWNGQEVIFSIYQTYYKGGPNHKWFDGRSQNATSSGTIVNQAIFRSRENNDLFPPDIGWVTIGTKRGGIYPGPTFRAVEIKQVTVEGCGLSKFNGMYTRVNDQIGDAPQYVKYGQYDGKAETHTIVRMGESWYIGNPGVPGSYKVCVDRWDDHPKIPPKEGWTAIVNKGIYPVPKLTWQ